MYFKISYYAQILRLITAFQWCQTVVEIRNMVLYLDTIQLVIRVSMINDYSDVLSMMKNSFENFLEKLVHIIID